MCDVVVLKVRRQAQHLRLKHYATFRDQPFALLRSLPRLGTGLGGVVDISDEKVFIYI